MNIRAQIFSSSSQALLLSAFLCGVIFTSQTCNAQHLTKVFFPNMKEARLARGMIYTQERSVEVPATWEHDSAREGITVTIPVPQELSLSETLVSGVVIDENNQIALSPLTIADLGNPMTIVPVCEPGTDLRVRPEQEGLYRQLVEIRERRAQVAQKKLRDTVSPALFERLRQLEVSFQLNSGKPLSFDLPVEELAERLDILYAAVERYELHKKLGKTNDAHHSPNPPKS